MSRDCTPGTRRITVAVTPLSRRLKFGADHIGAGQEECVMGLSNLRVGDQTAGYRISCVVLAAR